jgi:lipopolysaccharide export system permease protein
VRIVSKYLLKEHVGPFIFAATALTSLMLLQYIARRFGDLVGKGLGWQVITEFFVLSLPFTIAMTMPMAVLVAVLYAFSRLASENEITALKAGGVSMRKLLIPVLIAATGLALVMLAFNDQVLPRANHQLQILQTGIMRTKPTFVLKPQILNSVKEGQLYLSASQIDQATGKMRDVVIYDLADATRRRTIYADSGFLAFSTNQRDLEMKLYDGFMQSVPTETPGEITRLYYKKDRMRMANVASGAFVPTDGGEVSKGDREMSVCEMQVLYNRYDALLASALNDLDDAKSSLRPGATASKPKAAHKTRTTRSIGAVYCSLLDRLTPKKKEAPKPVVRQASIGESDATPEQLPPRPQQNPSAADTSKAAKAAIPGGRLLPAPPPVTKEEDDSRVRAAEGQVDEARRLRNRYAVEIEKKFSLAATCIIFVLVGAPIALRFPRGGVGLVLGVSFLIFALYYVGLIGGEALADRAMLSPFWAMWGANVIFLVLGLLMLIRMGTEANTGRGGDFRELLITIRSWLGRHGLPFDRRA